MLIPIKKIKSSPKPIRSKWGEKAMEELKKSIAEQGLIVPIKVRPLDGEYEIVYGHRRVEAMRRLGWKECEAIVEGIEPEYALLQAFIENVQREDLSVEDKAQAIKTIQEQQGWSLEEMDRRGIVPVATSSTWLAYLREPLEVRKTVSSMRDARDEGLFKAVFIGRELGDDTEAKIAVAEKARREDLTREQVREVARAVKTTPDQATRKAILETPIVKTPEEVKTEAKVRVIRDEAARIVEAERKERKRKGIDWDKFPSAAQVLHSIPRVMSLFKSLWPAVEMGKLSPEAKTFLARKLRELIELLQGYVDALEGGTRWPREKKL